MNGLNFMLGQILSDQALSMQANRLFPSRGGDTFQQDIQEGRNLKRSEDLYGRSCKFKLATIVAISSSTLG
jgi:hypothetical protein